LRSHETRANLLSADLEVDLYREAAEHGRDADATRLLQSIEATLANLPDSERQRPPSLRVEAKLQLFKKETARAIETLERALTIATDPTDRTRYEIMYLLAGAHQLDHNNSAAEKLYDQIIEYVDYPPARIELVRLLLARRAFDDAERHLVVLRQADPENDEVKKLDQAMRALRAGQEK
jgi:hypothetical protein